MLPVLSEECATNIEERRRVPERLSRQRFVIQATNILMKKENDHDIYHNIQNGELPDNRKNAALDVFYNNFLLGSTLKR